MPTSQGASRAGTGGFTDNAVTLLHKRYLEPGETIDGLLDRTSGGNGRFRRLMAERLFMPNSPTLMNKGTGKPGTSSACFVFHVLDSMHDGASSIMNTATKASMVAKWGGGVGYYLGHLRPKNAPIQTIHRKACGPVAVLKYYNEIGKLITQGGRRELAQMGILPWDHDDIREFIHVKDADPQSLRTFNISVSCTDEFMRRNTTAGSKEYDLWQEMGNSAWKTGDPGCYFFDTAERANPTPHLGRLRSTNPCGEIPLLSDEPCNLGSINLSKFVTANREVDWNFLEEVVVDATRFLDHILDANTFPHPDITAAAYLTRKLGLGVMGWADMLCLMHVHYDTEKAVDLAGQVMKFINDVALDTSLKLAAENGGPYPGHKEGPEVRNATRTAIAPTGSIYLLAGADGSGIEPHFAIETQRTMGDGTVLHEKVHCVESSGGFVPKTALEIPWQWHVRHQAAFQKHTDLACSKTINLPNSATADDMRAAYRLMWELGCKGGTVFRDGCRAGGEQVLVDKSKKTTKAVEVTEIVLKSDGQATRNGHVPAGASCRRRLPDERRSITHRFDISGVEGYLTVGLYEDGTPGELFMKISKEGTAFSGVIDSWAISTSLALQHGAAVDDLVRKFRGMTFEPNGLTKNKDIPTCTSVTDYVMRWLGLKFGTRDEKINQNGRPVADATSGQLCPECGAMSIYQGGCLACSKGCGWSRCG